MPTLEIVEGAATAAVAAVPIVIGSVVAASGLLVMFRSMLRNDSAKGKKQ